MGAKHRETMWRTLEIASFSTKNVTQIWILFYFECYSTQRELCSTKINGFRNMYLFEALCILPFLDFWKSAIKCYLTILYFVSAWRKTEKNMRTNKTKIKKLTIIFWYCMSNRKYFFLYMMLWLLSKVMVFFISLTLWHDWSDKCETLRTFSLEPF